MRRSLLMAEYDEVLNGEKVMGANIELTLFVHKEGFSYMIENRSMQEHLSMRLCQLLYPYQQKPSLHRYQRINRSRV